MIRSLLYVPANSGRFIASAHERGADAIVLDLEDSVVPSEKDAARAGLGAAVRAVGRNNARVFVRINSEPDRELIDAEAACRAGAVGLFIPKVESARRLQRLAELMSRVEEELHTRYRLAFVPMIETARGVFEARAVAGAHPRVIGMTVGGEDLATSMDAEPSPEVLRVPMMLVHLAAKAADILSFGLIRSVADFRDTDGIARAAGEARAFGFDGATCIHPSAVPILNRAFSPSAEEIDRARRLIAAADGKGAFVFEGKMADAPVVERARALLRKLEIP